MEQDNTSSLSESPALENLDAPLTDNGPTVIICVNQQDVLQTEKLPNQSSEWKSSSDWLQYHSLHMPEQLSQHTAKIILQVDGGASGQQQISSEAVSELEFKLYQMIELYHGRIRWLNQGSRKVFGVIQGSRVGLIIDSSDANCSSTEVRLQELQRNLQCLIEEQLSTKKQLYLMSFGSDHSSLWDSPKDINASRLQEAHGWVRELRPMGNCNLLQALQRGLELGRSQLDSLVIILGSRTEQTPDAIAEYAEQCMLGQELSVHVVSYCSSSATSAVKRLADVTHGRYHIVTASLCVVDDSTDVSVLRQEIQVARDLLSQTEALRQGHLEDMMTVLEDMTVSDTDEELQISAELEDLSLLLPCPDPANRSCLLNIKPSGVQDICSADWLRSNGLKAKRLGLYQVLSPNAYSPVEQFVPILNKTVTSTVHEKAMVQFEWHDGTVKNLHVDLPCIFNYQKQLQAVVCVLEKRVQWLSCGSRQIWGAVCEKRVQIVVDMSLMSSSLSLPIDLFLRRLLEEQLSNKHSFNIITFGSSVTMWRERMAPPTPENLGDAWQWFQSVQYSGNRTTLDGLRQALAGTLHDNSGSGTSSDHLTQGVYLFTSGLPVQEMGELCSYASESCSRERLRLHVCLFTNQEKDKHPSLGYTDLQKTAGALRELAQAGRGRFHWCTEEGIMESDDITLLTEEMGQAASYWEKSFKLVEALTQRGSCTCPGEVVPPGHNSSALIPQHLRSREGPIPLPKPTALTIARLQAKSEVSSTARAYTPPGQSMSGKRPLRTKSKQKKCNYASQSFFYLEDGNLGVMFKSYPKPKSVRKCIPSVALPKQEELCSTKQWLKRYSVRRLKLDLHRLLSGPDCAHRKKLVPSVLKAVSARYCSIFPSVQINGAVKHLQLTPGELEDYLSQTHRLLQRYLQRLHWLLAGSRRVFGTVLERDVCVLVDVSGSMAPCLAELKRDLSSLIWDQLHHNKIRFSLVAFSGEVRVWHTALQEPSEEQCRDAVEWVSQLDTHGCTNTLGALQAGCGFEDRVGLYLLSDGKPDCSCSLVLRETKLLTTGRHITVHTVSYNCSDSVANDFLRDMAHQTGGRYHRGHDDADSLITRLLASGGRDVDSPELPEFEGDDLRGLAREINKLGLFRKQAQSFRDIITKKTADAS